MCNKCYPTPPPCGCPKPDPCSPCSHQHNAECIINKEDLPNLGATDGMDLQEVLKLIDNKILELANRVVSTKVEYFTSSTGSLVLEEVPNAVSNIQVFYEHSIVEKSKWVFYIATNTITVDLGALGVTPNGNDNYTVVYTYI